MKIQIKNVLLLLACTGPMAMSAAAQTFTNLYNFTAIDAQVTEAGFGYGVNGDGANPYAGLILSGHTLYGTAQSGGLWGRGTVFAVNTDRPGFTNLYSFSPFLGGEPFTNSDGSSPYGGLVLLGSTLYGTAFDGGTNGYGTVFAINTDSTGFTNLHNGATGLNGAYPYAGLILSGNTLYGTTQSGGAIAPVEEGLVFALNTDGSGFTNVYDFSFAPGPDYTNSDGINPEAGLMLSGKTLYGTAQGGGSSGKGTVFAVNTDRTGFTNLYNFTNGIDGANPQSGLVLSGNILYGTAQGGGSSGKGAVFAVNTDGTGFRSLHSFTGLNGDGSSPYAGLILSGRTLYGTTSGGGASNGTVFAIDTDGSGFTNLYSFSATAGPNHTNSDGANPYAGLILSGNILYGTAVTGGANGNGTVFALSLVPSLSIVLAGNQVVLSWPAWAPNFSLWSTTNLASLVWSAVSPGQVVINGQNTVTNPIVGTQQFYRLSLLAIPSGMALIPAGSFTMGDTLDGESDAIPTNVTVSAFYMETNLVSYSQWQTVYAYATSHGYGFDYAGAGKAANHPVQTVDWYDVVKWSNARSQQAGLTAVYYTDAGLTQVYTNGDVAPYVNWAANGYRLPTEAEWEKAARGGLSGLRFPWGDTVSESQANYYGDTGYYSYDLGPNGYNTLFDTGAYPYTSPVGYFAANGYGLYDMAGNVYEWCWDWYGTPYGQPTITNPTGPPTGSYRVLRGGSWNVNAAYAGAYRNYVSPDVGYGNGGFRCVRGL